MVKIHLEYTSVLDVRNAENNSDVILPEGATVTDLLSFLEIKPEHQRFVIASVDGKKRSPGSELQDGDHVVLSLPIGGG